MPDLPPRIRPASDPETTPGRGPAVDALGCAFVFVPAGMLMLVMAFGAYWGASPAVQIGLGREPRIWLTLGIAALCIAAGVRWVGGHPRGIGRAACVLFGTVILTASTFYGLFDGHLPAVVAGAVSFLLIVGAFVMDARGMNAP